MSTVHLTLHLAFLHVCSKVIATHVDPVCLSNNHSSMTSDDLGEGFLSSLLLSSMSMGFLRLSTSEDRFSHAPLEVLSGEGPQVHGADRSLQAPGAELWVCFMLKGHCVERGEDESPIPCESSKTRDSPMSALNLGQCPGHPYVEYFE